jgi:CRISPR-associated endonuclease/helicase Cas3
MEPLAHSARRMQGIPAQGYTAHVLGVLERARDNAARAAQYMPESKRALFVDVVSAAAVLHDLGKLDEENQKVLRSSSKETLPIKHSDAGVALLRRPENGRDEEAVLVHGHHGGLCSILDEANNGGGFLRVPDVAEHVDKNLEQYVADHIKAVGGTLPLARAGNTGWSGLTRRMAMSCLVDADYGDTAEHYGNEKWVAPSLPRWAERLVALDAYVASLGQANRKEGRAELRRLTYEACREAAIEPPLRACDSPVGSGKTTAVMAHLLRVAQSKEPNLRHILVVVPFTNIIKQSVDTYRKALVLPGEQPDEIIAEHHHQADFEELELRQLAALWRAPVTVTTAVQFFETLASNQPSRLRKLHELAGSAIFIDEAHTALPSWFWPQAWLWLKDLVIRWGCHVVLASGSLVRFWRLSEFVNPPEDLPDVVPADLRQQAASLETSRICYPTPAETAFSLKTLVEFVLSKRGPRLVIMNTVQSAAVLANELQKTGNCVLHLSTALTPADRDLVVERVQRLLCYQMKTDWTLVATSCVEAGMDFSFRTAFRESCGAASLIQVGGRVNRHGEWDGSDVFDFRVSDPLLNRHPAFDVSRDVLGQLFAEGALARCTPTEAVTEAARREVMSGQNPKAGRIRSLEKKMDYPGVASLCRVIDADTRLVVVDRRIIGAIRNHEKVIPRDLLRGSVQLWTTKIKDLDVQPISGKQELYAWTMAYDPDFLGYMAGVLPLVYAKQEGFVV